MVPDPKALEVAYAALAKKDLFEAEIRALLIRKAFGEEVVEAVLLRLRERKLVDDARTAAKLAALRTGKRAVGVEKLRALLLQRGVSESDVDHLMPEREPESDLDAAMAALMARFKPGSVPSPAQAGRFLAGRGFGEETVQSCLEAFFQGVPESMGSE